MYGSRYTINTGEHMVYAHTQLNLLCQYHMLWHSLSLSLTIVTQFVPYDFRFNDQTTHILKECFLITKSHVRVCRWYMFDIELSSFIHITNNVFLYQKRQMRYTIRDERVRSAQSKRNNGFSLTI